MEIDYIHHPKWTEGVGVRLIMIMLGIILLFAAAAKTYETLSKCKLSGQIAYSDIATQIASVLEMVVGAWLLCGLYIAQARCLAIVLFAVMGFVAAIHVYVHSRSCGCFGQLVVRPWYTLLIDLSAVSLLIKFRPHACGVTKSCERKLLRSSVGFLVIIITLISVDSWTFHRPMVVNSLDVFGTRDVVILDPESWVGKPMPLAEHIDVGHRLISGNCTVVLYQSDCPHCRSIVPQYDRLAAETTSNVALIEMPPYANVNQSLVSATTRAIIGRLDSSHTWICETPTVIEISNGNVVSARVGDDAQLTAVR